VDCKPRQPEVVKRLRRENVRVLQEIEKQKTEAIS
jgi:hypothetical protein